MILDCWAVGRSSDISQIIELCDIVSMIVRIKKEGPRQCFRLGPSMIFWHAAALPGLSYYHFKLFP